jgi:hypothetical protein
MGSRCTTRPTTWETSLRADYLDTEEEKTVNNNARVILVAVAVLLAAALAACDLGVTERSTSEPAPGVTTEAPAMEFDAQFGAVHCDKVTTFVCPDGTCLCEQQNCGIVTHNGDFAPCSGPPAPGCQHNFANQICFPVGQPIQCDAASVPVGRCSFGCISGDVTCSSEGACCRCERPCYPRVRPPQN